MIYSTSIKLNFSKFSNLPTETWKEVLDFCKRIELANGASTTNWLFNAISDKMMHEEREHSLRDTVLDGNQELPITEIPKNIIAGKSRLRIK